MVHLRELDGTDLSMAIARKGEGQLYLIPTEYGAGFVAAERHDGQGSALYQLASSNVATRDDLETYQAELELLGQDGDDDAAAVADELAEMLSRLHKYAIVF